VIGQFGCHFQISNVKTTRITLHFNRGWIYFFFGQLLILIAWWASDMPWSFNMYITKHIRDEYCLLECNAMLAGRNRSLFWRNLLPPSLEQIVNFMDKIACEWKQKQLWVSWFLLMKLRLQIDSPFRRVAKEENSHLVLKIFQVYIQHFNSEKGRLETKLLMFRENLMKKHKLLHSMFMGHQKK